MICKHCLADKPETEFSWKIKTKGLRQSVCKPCAASVGREWRKQRKELLGEEGCAQYEKDRYSQNRQAQLEYHRAYYQANPDRAKAQRRKGVPTMRADIAQFRYCPACCNALREHDTAAAPICAGCGQSWIECQCPRQLAIPDFKLTVIAIADMRVTVHVDTSDVYDITLNIGDTLSLLPRAAI